MWVLSIFMERTCGWCVAFVPWAALLSALVSIAAIPFSPQRGACILAFTAAVATHLRLPCPLGQLPVLNDVPLSLLSRLGRAGPLDLLLAVLTVPTLDLFNQAILLIAAMLLWFRWRAAQAAVSSIRRQFLLAGVGESELQAAITSRPSLPWLMRLCPPWAMFHLLLTSELPGHMSVQSTTAGPNGQKVDIWSTEHVEHKGVVLFIHGGGWRGGHHRGNSSTVLLQRLAVDGWVVVACS